MKQKLFSLYFRMLDGRNKRLLPKPQYHTSHLYGRNYPHDNALVRAFMDCAARNFDTWDNANNNCVAFRRFVTSYWSTTTGGSFAPLLGFKPADVIEVNE